MREGRMEDELFGLDYIPLEGWEVRKSRWPFAHHLNQLHRGWVYLRRVLRTVKCPNPVTGDLDTPFEDFIWGIGEPDGPFESLVWGVDVHDDGIWRWTDGIRQDFSQSESRLQTALARCVAMISKEALKQRCELWWDELDVDDARQLLELADAGRVAENPTAWQHGFFFEAGIAGSIVGHWQERLAQLRRGETLMVWKQAAVMRGARQGGRVASEGRRKVSAAQVSEYFEKLAAGGTAARDAAAIVARRLGIHPDHARRLRRRMEGAPKARGKTKPT